MAKKQNSASNVAEMAPVSTKASANVTGATGAARAAVFIKETEAYAHKVAGVVLEAQRSMKDRLRDLIGLTREDYIAFRNALQVRVDQIGKEAEKAKISVSEYRKADREADVIYVTLSLWKKMATAVEVGWMPDFDKPWSEISQAATQALDAEAARIEQAKVAEQIAKIEADPTLKPEVKQAQVVILKAQMAATPVRTKGGRPAAKPKSLIELIEGLVKDRPIHEVEAAFVWLGNYLSEKSKSSARLVNSEMKKHGETATLTPSASAGNLKPGQKIGRVETEKATAHQPRRSAKGSRK